MAYCSEARITALGATPNIGLNNVTANIDMWNLWPLDTNDPGAEVSYSAHKWHSAQWRSTVQEQWLFYRELLGRFQISVP